MMHEIKMNHKTIDGVDLETWEQEITNCNVLLAEAGTTCHRPKTEDGARTFFSLKCIEDISMKVSPIFGKWDETIGFEVEMCGDDALDSIIEALKYITHVLEEECGTFDI